MIERTIELAMDRMSQRMIDLMLDRVLLRTRVPTVYLHVCAAALLTTPILYPVMGTHSSNLDIQIQLAK